MGKIKNHKLSRYVNLREFRDGSSVKERECHAETGCERGKPRSNSLAASACTVSASSSKAGRDSPAPAIQAQLALDRKNAASALTAICLGVGCKRSSNVLGNTRWSGRSSPFCALRCRPSTPPSSECQSPPQIFRIFVSIVSTTSSIPPARTSFPIASPKPTTWSAEI
jgi:hypothetical protein